MIRNFTGFASRIPLSTNHFKDWVFRGSYDSSIGHFPQSKGRKPFGSKAAINIFQHEKGKQIRLPYSRLLFTCPWKGLWPIKWPRFCSQRIELRSLRYFQLPFEGRHWSNSRCGPGQTGYHETKEEGAGCVILRSFPQLSHNEHVQ